MIIGVTVILLVSCLILIASVLMQSGKSAGLSGSIAGGAEQLFGKQKARGWEAAFDKATKASAVAFLVSALVLAKLMSH